MIKLNLGCGYKKKEGYINIDSNKYCNPDMILDLNKPLPFKDMSVSEVYIEHVLSYVEDINNLFSELYRICNNGARIVLKVPHYSFGFVDPYHRRGVSIEFINFINSYKGTKFRIKSLHIIWMKNPSNILLKYLNRILSYLANANPKFCERIWCYWWGGFEELVFQIIVEK